jgi:nitroreductase
MDFLDLLESRRSVQNFLPGKRIPRKDLATLFERTCKAPSSWNLQPWKFLVIEEEARQAEIRKMAWDQPKVTDCSALVLVLGDTDPHRNKKRIFDQWRDNGIIDDEIHGRWMDAVGMVYPTDYEKHEFAIRNSTLAAMTLMLAAWDMGYATCPMIGFDKKAVSEFVGIENGWILSFIIALGTADGQPAFPRQQRFSFEDVVCFERF